MEGSRNTFSECCKIVRGFIGPNNRLRAAPPNSWEYRIAIALMGTMLYLAGRAGWFGFALAVLFGAISLFIIMPAAVAIGLINLALHCVVHPSR